MTGRRWVWTGLAAAVLVGGVLSLFASRSPDGLQKVAADKGFGQAAERPVLPSALAGYRIPGIRQGWLAAGLAGFGGTIVLFAAGAGVGRLARRPRKPVP